jgi:hypothetical protein
MTINDSFLDEIRSSENVINSVISMKLEILHNIHTHTYSHKPMQTPHILPYAG